MQILGRPLRIDLARSPGVARLAFEGLIEDACAAKRLFTRAAAELPKLVEVDVRRMSAPSSAVWAVIVKGVFDLTRRGRDIKIYADAADRRLLESSGLTHRARIVIAWDRRVA